MKRDINTICLASSFGTYLAAVLHREIQNGQIRQKGTTKSQAGNARTETRNSQERTVGKEGVEPQAGNRDRALTGEKSRREGST